MPRRSIPLLAAVLAAAAAVPAPALGASAGQTFLTGGLALPPGALVGGDSGRSGDGADRSAASDDGRYVAFVSQADTLDPAAHPDVVNVYRKDRLTGAVVLVSRADGATGATAPFASDRPAISDDGARVAFLTAAPLDPADADGARDVYVRDVAAGTTTLASVGAADAVGDFDLSGNGRFVAFATTAAVDGAADGNAHSDVYRRDLVGRSTVLVSDDAAGGVRAGDRPSYRPSISDDGVWVAFVSQANVASPYTPGSGNQVFVRDMTAGTTYLVSSRDGARTTGSNGEADEPDVAGAPPTGRADRVVVAYTSRASDLDAGDDGSTDASVFVRVLSGSGSELVSRADGAAGAGADSRAHTPSIGDDGRSVAFSSDATNLGAGADYYGVYVRDLVAARTRLVSADNAYAVQGAIAGGGGLLAWYEGGGATADSDPELGGVFGRAWDAAAGALGAVELVSRPPGTAPFLLTAIEVEESDPGARTISADGRYVVLTAFTTARLPGGRAGGPPQVYRRDTLTGATELVSRANGAAGAPSAGYNTDPTISADGRRVAFRSSGALDPAHGDGSVQLYVRDLAAGTTTLASRADGPGGALPNDDVVDPAISADGARVAFATGATNMGVPGSDQHVYVRDLAAGTTQLVDRASGAAGAPADDNGELPSLSADGRLVAFGSQGANLDPADPDRSADVYVRDTVAGVTTLVSRRNGLAGAKAVGPTWYPSLSADGSVVAFQAGDETIAPEAGGWGGRRQVVARTLATGANVLVSRAPGGPPADADAADPSVSDDGGVVAFESYATNLIPGVGGGSRRGVFARLTATGALVGPPAFGLLGNEPQNRAGSASISGDGQCLALTALGHNAATGPAGDVMTTYVHVVSGVCPKPLPAIVARRPGITSASLSRKRFRVGRRATAKVAGAGPARAAARRRRRRATPAGTTIRFRLSERANVGVAIERPAAGRLVGRFCRRPSRRLRRNLRCVRQVKVGALSRRGLRAGGVSIAFSGRIGRRALRPGAYRIRMRASNAAGVSPWVRLGFRVVRR